MKKRATKRTRKQANNATCATALQGAIQQLVLPLVAGVEATKNGLLGFVHQMGMAALDELLAGEAAAIAGPKGKHAPGRTHHHWGTTRSPLPLRWAHRGD